MSDLEARGADLAVRASPARGGTRPDDRAGWRRPTDILKERAAELDRLNRLYEEASLASVDSRAELLGRVGEIEELAGDVDMLRAARLEAEKQIRTLESELRAALDGARAEKKKTVDIEKRAERMLATLADRDDTIRRHERELADLRERLKREAAARSKIEERLARALDERNGLEAQIADLTLRLSRLAASAEGGGAAEPEERADARRPDERLVAMTRENQKLRADLAAGPRRASGRRRPTTPGCATR